MQYFSELETLLDASSAPYSGFNVASIAVSKSGKAFSGVNVESVAYPTTMCAERTAIFSAIASGVKRGEIAEVHILARNIEKKLIGAFPCGSCRQVISEQSNNEAKIYVYNSKTDILEYSIAELLPNAFFSLD